MKSITILKSRFTGQGGAEKYARCLAEAFFKKGCQVTVLTTDPVVGSFPFEIISTPLKSHTSVSKLWEFERFCEHYIQTHPTDCLFGHDRNRFQTHIRAGSGVHKSFLETRKHYEPAWKRWRHALNPLHTSLLHFEKTSFEHPDLEVLFTNSYLVKSQILAHYNVEEEKIHVVHNGVEWHKWQKSFDEWDTVYTPNRFDLLFLGSNFGRKGLLPLLKGLKAYGNKDIHLSVVGKDKQQKWYENLVSKWGLTHQVTFYGSQDQITPFLQKADALAIPSYYDPFANVTVEALAMGLFVMSSTMNGGCEVLNEETGCVIEDLNSPDDMKAALEKAVSKPKTKERAASIRQSVQHLDFSTQLQAYLDLCLSPTFASA